MIKRALSDNLEFVIASSAYVISHVIDYLLTVQGIAGSIAREGNPVIREYISLFGVKGGLLAYKSLICGGIILGMKAIDSLRRRKRTRSTRVAPKGENHIQRLCATRTRTTPTR